MDDLEQVFSDLNAEEVPHEEVVTPEPEKVVEAEAPIVEEVIQPVVELPKEEKTVPLATFLDQRDELKELKRYRAEMEAKAATPRNAPDLYDMKPEEVAAYVEEVATAKALNTKFEMSEVLAKQAHGDETVDAAGLWALEKAKTDPTFRDRYMRNAHPIDFIVRQYKRDGLVSQLPEDISSIDELVEREIARRAGTAPGAVAVTAPVQQQASRPAAPPKSLVNAPSRGGVSDVPVGKLAGLDAVFPG